MNIAAAAAYLLTHFSPEEREIPENSTYPGRNAAVAKALNGALQHLFGKGGKWVRTDDRGAILNPPITISIAVTNGSKSATIANDVWQSWFAGCSIIIDGAAVDNQIRNNAADVVLKFPYSGTTGTKTATIYHDSIDLDTDVLEVADEVKIDRVPLSKINTPSRNSIAPQNIEDFGFHRNGFTRQIDSVAAGTGNTTGFIVETWSPDATTEPRTRIRFSPAPSKACFVDYSVMLCPPRVTDIASTNALPIPFDFMESIFLPLALKQLRGCPFWRGMVADDEVESGYQNALALLGDADPDKTDGFSFTTQF
jgi:hypothetical protein